MTTPIIEVRNLVKHFGPVIALNGVSLSVEPGQVHCLLGDNGAGKSTLIKTLSGVHKPTSGEFLLKANRLSSTVRAMRSITALRRSIRILR